MTRSLLSTRENNCYQKNPGSREILKHFSAKNQKRNFQLNLYIGAHSASPYCDLTCRTAASFCSLASLAAFLKMPCLSGKSQPYSRVKLPDPVSALWNPFHIMFSCIWFFLKRARGVELYAPPT